MGAAVPCTNLDERAHEFQLRLGVGLCTLSLVVGVIAVELGTFRPWRLALVVPFWFGSYALHQGMFRTCSFRAARGLRATELGPEPIVDRAELEAVRDRGRWMLASSLVFAVIATACFVLP